MRPPKPRGILIPQKLATLGRLSVLAFSVVPALLTAMAIAARAVPFHGVGKKERRVTQRPVDRGGSRADGRHRPEALCICPRRVMLELASFWRSHVPLQRRHKQANWSSVSACLVVRGVLPGCLLGACQPLWLPWGDHRGDMRKQVWRPTVTTLTEEGCSLAGSPGPGEG